MKYEILEITVSELSPGQFVGYVGFQSEEHGKESAFVGGNPTSDDSEARLWAAAYALQLAKEAS